MPNADRGIRRHCRPVHYPVHKQIMPSFDFQIRAPDKTGETYSAGCLAIPMFYIRSTMTQLDTLIGVL